MATFRQGADMCVRSQAFEIRVFLNIPGGYLSGPLYIKNEGFRFVSVKPKRNLLEIQNQIGSVLNNVWE